MLIEEAIWFGRQLERVDKGLLSPMLNLGSSTEAYRMNFQPWIDQYVLQPLKHRDIIIKNQDIKAMPGVDIVGDLSDPRFVAEFSRQSFNAVLCFNLLEHLKDRIQFADSLLKILPGGAYLFVSCPHRFPYHPDPIDTLFRPSVCQVADLFPGAEKIAGEIVVCQTYFNHLSLNRSRWLTLFKLIVRLCFPLYRPRMWLLKLRHLPWLFRKLEATCLVLRKG